MGERVGASGAVLPFNVEQSADVVPVQRPPSVAVTPINDRLVAERSVVVARGGPAQTVAIDPPRAAARRDAQPFGLNDTDRSTLHDALTIARAKHLVGTTYPDAVAAALNGMGLEDGRITVFRSFGSVRVAFKGREVATFREPLADNVDGWVALAERVIDRTRELSPKVRAASSGTILGALLDQMTYELDSHSRYVPPNEVPPPSPTVLVAEPAPNGDISAHSAAPVVPSKRVLVAEGPTWRVERDGTTELVTLSRFDEHLVSQIRAASAAGLPGAAGPIKEMVIDLRGNRGGNVSNADMVAKALFGAQESFLSRYRGEPDPAPVSLGAIDKRALPLVVLVDGNSASASEIIAASMQDHGRGVLMGTDTYGKGTAQTPFDLPNGGRLWLTEMQWFAPSGYSPDGQGVLPTICLADAASPAAALQAFREGRLQMPIEAAGWSVDKTNAEAAHQHVRDACKPGELPGDAVVDAAISLARDPVLYRRALAQARAVTDERVRLLRARAPG